MLWSTPKFLDRLAYSLVALFALDRFLKLAAVMHFFRRPPPPPPAEWPAVTLLQPITRGANGLYESLSTRAQLDYPAAIQHLLICDARDAETLAQVTTFLEAFPQLHASIIIVDSAGDGAVATKINKFVFYQLADALVKPGKWSHQRANALEFCGHDLYYQAHSHQWTCIRVSP